MTSSLRNSLHRRNHKERSQLANRSKLGLLEKHADYVKRARDYHSKQDRLKRLKQKAADRNKDEFYFAMTGQRTKGGVHHHERGNVALPMDIIKVLKTQDENYIRTVRSAGLKKIERIKNQLTMLANLVSSSKNRSDDEDELDDAELEILQSAGIIRSLSKSRRSVKPKLNRNHVLFVENADEAQSYSTRALNPAEAMLTQVPTEKSDIIDLGWKTPKSKGKQKATSLPASVDLPDGLEDNEMPSKSTRTRLLKELSARLARDTQLRYAMRELEMQRLMVGKGRRTKIQGVEKVEGDDDKDDEDEDEIDANKGRRRAVRRVVDEKLYKPRVYKWKLERKR